jgi:peroxiredoxin
MLHRFAVILICLLGLATVASAQPAIGTAAPNFTLNRSNGGSETLSNYLGEVVLLDFFGATCGDCIADAPLVQDVYEMFATNSDFNMIGIDVWNLPAPYVNTTFRAQTGITFTLLVNGRTTGYAYNMETNPVPSATDNEHRGIVLIDRQGIMRNYWIYTPFDVPEQQQIVQELQCELSELLDAPQAAALVLVDEDTCKLCWHLVPCASRYTVFRSLTHDWTDETIIGTTTTEVFILNIHDFERAAYRVVAERN